MSRPDDTRSKAMYHARMFALALLGALTIFLALIGAFWVLAWLGVLHVEDR
jgi:hypothetical protein